MFRFRFESLLNHRRHEEEVAQKMLYEAQMNLRREQEDFKRLKKERRESIYKMENRQTGPVAPHEITLALNYIKKLSDQLERRQLDVHQAERRVTTRHQALIDAVKKRRMLEKLKENEHRRYQRDLIKKDLKFMDEVAVNRHARSQS